nr:hypothetical protein [Tanacetum cinerariifolium]
FLENKPIVASTGPTWLFDINSLTRTMNYHPVHAGNQSNLGVSFQEKFDAEKAGEEIDQSFMLFPVWSVGSINPQNNAEDAAFDGKEHDFDVKKPESKVILSPSSCAQSKEQDDKTKKEANGKSHVESVIGYRDLNAEFEDCSNNSSNEVNVAGSTVSTVGQNSLNNTVSAAGLEAITYSDDEDVVGVEANLNNLESSIPVSPIPTTRIHKDHHVSHIIGDLSSTTQTRSMTKAVQDQGGLSQMFGNDFHTCMFACFLSQEEPKRSAFLYGTIEEEVYVCQPLGFEDLDHPDKVYKVVKALYGLYQVPRAWYETLATYLLENVFIEVKQKKDGIFISQDKYIAEILRKFKITEGKLASTPIDTEKPLLKDPDGEDVDVHTYRSMIGSLMYITSSRPDIMFAVCACARFQVTPKALQLHAVKRIFRYLKGKPHLGLWYLKDSPFDLVAYSNSDYAGVVLSRMRIGVNAAGLNVSAVRHKFLQFSLTKWCCSLSAVSYIKYALTINPHIYVSYIKQFWNTVIVKQTNDVTRLQALVDKKKVVITVATIRDALRLDDAEGVDCLPNEEIFAELARMSCEKPLTKLIFYKAFFSCQWKFLIHTILQLMSAKCTSWNEFNSPMASAKVFANMRRVGKGFSRVETPLFEGMLVGVIEEGGDVEEQVQDVAADTAAQGADTAAIGDVVQDQSIPSPTPPTPPPQ